MIDDYREHLLKIYKDIFIGFDDEELLKLNNLLLRINENLKNVINKDSLLNLKE